MLRYSRGKIVAVLLLTVYGFLLALPNLWSKETRDVVAAWVPKALPAWIIPHRAMTLGLDLQGGLHVMLEVDRADVVRGLVNGLRDDVRRILRDERVAAPGGIALILPREADALPGVEFVVPDPVQRARVMPKVRELSQPLGNQLIGSNFGRSLDITEDSASGRIRVLVTQAQLLDKVRRSIDQSIEVIRRRVDITGVTEPSIQRQGADRIVVQLPGLQDAEKFDEILGKTAKLEFRFLAEAGAASAETEQLVSQETGQRVSVERRVIVGGEDLIDAQAAFNQQTGQPVVNFRFNIRGAQRFGQATSENVGRLLAIVLDNEVISAPQIRSAITGGQGEISGGFTVEKANNLAVLLRAGALPAKLTIVERRSVGPGLGRDSIEAGAKATYIAAVFVVLFMFAVYGVFGLFANIALMVHVVFIFALMSALGATLTLPGIAGVVLTIGTAVDSNVLIYERIREEYRGGRSIITAIETGFTRAFATIFDSNSTMAIAALILFLIGSGPVRGFAVVFLFGIMTTVITAVTMTRMMIALWYYWARPKVLPF